MKHTLSWAGFILLLNLLAAWIVIGPWLPENTFVKFLVAMFFLAPSVGTFWMIYVAVRYEAKPWPFVAIALISFSCLWYYGTRYRTGRYMTRSPEEVR